MEEIIAFIYDFAEKHDPVPTKLKKRFPFRKIAGHCYRTYRWAQRINEIEKGDKEMVEISSLFHDIGACIDNSIEGHAIESARVCEEYLKAIGYDSKKRDIIVGIVRNHVHIKRPQNMSLEAKIERDADILDEVGAITVLWDAMDAGTQKEQSYEIVYERIKKAYDGMRQKPLTIFETETAKTFYRDRLSFLSFYLQNLAYELGLIDVIKGDESYE